MPPKYRVLLIISCISVADDDCVVIGNCDQPAIGAKGGRSLPAAARGEGRNWLTDLGIPQPRRVVVGCRKDAPAVRAEHGTPHRSAVSLKDGQLLACLCFSAPQTRGGIFGYRKNVPTIGAEHGAPHRFQVAPEYCRELAAVSMPNAGR